MDRRNFFKLVGTASGGAITGACGKTGQELIPLLVPEEAIVPGEEEWHPSVCRQCSAGCGTIVRVMEAEREIEVEGEKVRERIAAIKKIEGNPLDPVSGGRLCGRGQAAVQALYHPDRVRGPLKRDAVAEGGFRAISWEEALDEAGGLIAEAVEKNPAGIVYLAGPGSGTRAVVVDRFLRALGASAATTTGVCDLTVERRAAELLHGQGVLPSYEIQDATYVLGLGADFLGAWASPVLYARRFGHFRRGRPGIRGKLVHAESRFSQTAWSADRWLPVAPGGEHALALGLGHVLVQRGLGQGAVSDGVRDVFAAVDLERAAAEAGLTPKQIEHTAGELAEAKAPLVVPGASIVQQNSLDAVVTAGVLNILLGNIGKPGGVRLPPGIDWFEKARPEYEDLKQRLDKAELVLLDGANPAYESPPVAELLVDKTVISFASVLDDSAALSHLVMPDHDALETAALVAPEVADRPAVTGSRAFVRPLYDTRATEEILIELAKRTGAKIDGYSPQDAFEQLYQDRDLGAEGESAVDFSAYAERQGGWWGEPEESDPTNGPASVAAQRPIEATEPSGEYAYRFQAYPSLQFGGGSGAHLPWLQQMPDPTSSVMWGLPVEIDPGTAKRLGVVNGDAVRVTSDSGSIEAAVYVHPAAIPGVVSMALGQGHTHYGRYASGRGANPLRLTAGVQEEKTGVPVLGSVWVKIEKLGARPGLVQFAAMDREVTHKRM